MELFDIVTYVVGAIVLISLLAMLYEAWPLVLLVLAIVLINKFTMWASVVIFLLVVVMNPQDDKTQELSKGAALIESMVSAFKVTFCIVVAAWFIGMLFSGDGSGSVPCGRATPHGC
ncbi:hypothetical protein [Shewanella sp. MBTL60-007]|uniref:hypothetical protein n=1 Tax=Shewanella sp. MBTL60-007 TaxID=2815911 RepID=UPI001C81A284|nr:hypothetical protein [Shewanella sp. MBTL60-007]